MVSQTHLKFEEVFTKWKIQTVVFCITSVISQVITYVWKNIMPPPSEKKLKAAGPSEMVVTTYTVSQTRNQYTKIVHRIQFR
jgi:hypothetical protein